MRRLATLVVTALSLALASTAGAQRTEGDYVARDFRFASGETLPQLRIH